ncbi:MAG: InlB B-repeat-containing protein [Bacteroidales bacterium]|nr:InlB B-repeat-containing protein [Bacteroidales bacterium]
MKSYSIGREAGCDIVLNDNTDVISRRHAVLTVASSGKMTITDLSTNGTYINGQRISSNVAVPVSRKDSVSFAHVSTLDWNIIPKSNQWLTYLIIGLVVCAIGAACAIFIPKIIDNSGDIVNPPVVDSIACTITFDANGGQGTMEAQRFNRGQKTGLNKNKESITMEGSVFKGWNTQVDGRGVAYEDGEAVTFYENTTLYAQWEQKTHTITFIQNDRKVGGKMEMQTVPEGTDTALEKCAYTKKGYRFKGWNTESNGKGTAYKDGDIVNLKEDLKLYAQWERNGGGSGSGGENYTGGDNTDGDNTGGDNTGDSDDKPIL